jgi:hypothetical protein
MKKLKTFDDFFNELKEDYATDNINIDNINEEQTENNIPNIIGLLFQSRDISHIVHLSTGSYAGHKALNEYYDELLDKIDELAEIYQGINGKIEISILASKNEDIISHLENLHKKVSSSKKTIENDEINAKIDEILELISTTLYKLKELK